MLANVAGSASPDSISGMGADVASLILASDGCEITIREHNPATDLTDGAIIIDGGDVDLLLTWRGRSDRTLSSFRAKIADVAARPK